MRWVNFLHFYQPFSQKKEILEAIVNQSYRPLLKGLKESKKAKIVLNISGALTELFDKYGYTDLIEDLIELGKAGKIEFTSTAKYHAFLPLLSDEEVIRQIKLNDETNKHYFGDVYNPKGFFPPEMGYSENLPKILENLGFKWIIIDEIACGGVVENVDYTKLYKIKNSNLLAFFRNRRVSNLIMSSVVRSKDTLLEALHEDISSNKYLLTAMDGETFGHHRVGLEKLLFEVFDYEGFEFITMNDLVNFYKEVEEINPVKSTWASSEADIKANSQFLSWNDPTNELHKMQWEFVHFVLDFVKSLNPEDETVRKKLDVALASDQFFWASAKPWWSVEMIEEGAFRLLDAINSSTAKEDVRQEAASYYQKIVYMAFDWQRSGKMKSLVEGNASKVKIPFKERTLEAGGREEGIYHAFIDMMKGLEKEACEKGEYEKAILWRDAIYRIENKLDIYEAINAIDLLRLQIPHYKVEETLDEYTKKYKEIRGGQPEQRS